MKAILPRVSGSIAIRILLGGLTTSLPAASIQSVTTLPGAQTGPAGGSGDSCLSVFSSDGRYVLFASLANNLVLTSNSFPIPARVPARFNVYLRDRVNQTTSLVTSGTNGIEGGNNDSFPVAISTNGQLALFESKASNLVAGDTNDATDIFIRNLVSGELVLISANSNGLPANGGSRSAVMTPDARYVAFVSEASDLVSGDSNRIADVFLRDLHTATSTLVSVGAQSTNGSSLVPLCSSEAPQLTPDGRFVAFLSTATNLVPGVQTTGELFVHDRIAGTNLWASCGMRDALLIQAGKTNGIAYELALSASGKYVVYEASLVNYDVGTLGGLLLRYGLETGLTELIHTNVLASLPTALEAWSFDVTPDGSRVAFVANTNSGLGTTTCILVWDAGTGLLKVASANLSNAVTTGSVAMHPVLDPTGRFVAFVSTSSSLVTNSSKGLWHVYVRDLVEDSTSLVNADPDGVGSPVTAATVPTWSADTRYVAFEGEDGNLTPHDRNRSLDVFVRDRFAATNELISACHSALESRTPNGPSTITGFSASVDGRYVAYASEANNLTDDDTNQVRDIFIRDLATGSNLLVSVALSERAGNNISSEPAISGAGRYVTFASSASDLVADDTNGFTDVFVRDLDTRTTVLASRRASDGGAASGNSYSPFFSTDGRWLAFRSQAKDLTSGSIGGSENLFIRDLQAGTNLALTSAGVSIATVSPEGRYVAYQNGTSQLFVWDAILGAQLLWNSNNVLNALSVSREGRHLAFSASGKVWFIDRMTQSAPVQIPGSISTYPTPRISADGKWLVYARYIAPWYQICLYDIQNQTERLVSHTQDPNTGASGNSTLPDINPDGRFVVYRSTATNIVAAPANGITRQIILFDRETGANSLVSASRLPGGSGDDDSYRALFSADGQTLLVQSWASDLTVGDFNYSGDVFATTILTATILPAASPGEGPWLSWPIQPGGSYRVQFKNRFDDAEWQDVLGTSTNRGVKSWLQDAAPADFQRLYRVVSY